MVIFLITETKVRFANGCAVGIYCPNKEREERKNYERERERETGSADGLTLTVYARLSLLFFPASSLP